jgi:hypothetical protein
MFPSVRHAWNWTPRGPGWALVRRGVAHGFVRRGGRTAVTGPVRALWEAAEPFHHAAALREDVARLSAPIRRSRALLDRVRAGRGGFHRDVWRRLAGQPRFVVGGASRDLADEREIEKIHADRARGRGFDARDLWAKLSWISRDERDASLRIRFSFGSELHSDWSRNPRRAVAADEFAEAAFPECTALARNRRVLSHLARATGAPVRLSERILFSNAPGGGAAFHHDAETEQLGVAYAQLAGRTAWLALPKRELAASLRELAPRSLAGVAGTDARAMRALDGHHDSVEHLLNADAQLTRRLAERGRLYVLNPGDLLLLPSPSPNDTAWHSVFALGARPSLALSFGIFRRGR